MEEMEEFSTVLGSDYSSLIYDDKVIIPSHARHVLRNLKKMRGNKSLCDTELFCEGQVVR